MTGNGDRSCSELMRSAAKRLSETLELPLGEARREAEILLGHATDWSRAQVIARLPETIPSAIAQRFSASVERRAAGEPIAYILGMREFFGLAFQVSSAVLIPRPETELLVELALQRIPMESPTRALDLGTGCGCIAIALAKLRPACRITAVDASREALYVASGNIARHGVSNVKLLQAHWFEEVRGERFDIVVSNPPYVAASDPHLAQGDLRYEPALALTGGADGLVAIRLIVSQAASALLPAGWLLLEHGYDQADAVGRLMEASGFAGTSRHSDLTGRVRVTTGQSQVS